MDSGGLGLISFSILFWNFSSKNYDWIQYRNLIVCRRCQQFFISFPEHCTVIIDLEQQCSNLHSENTVLCMQYCTAVQLFYFSAFAGLVLSTREMANNNGNVNATISI